MITIMLIRHGETDWNRESIFRGQTDVALNSRGLKQAWLLAKYLSNAHLTAVYSSPLQRAFRMAEVVAKYHHIKVLKTQELIDIHYGVWQGLPQRSVMEKYSQLYEQWLMNPHLVKIPQGETLEEVRARGLSVITRLLETGDGNIVIVSHRVVNKILICALLGLDNSHFWNITQDTCGITTFIYRDERFILTKHNDTSFLKQLGNIKEHDF